MCCGGFHSRLPFRVAGPQGERLPVLEPEHLARRRRRVPAPTPGTVSPTALAYRSHLSLQMGQKGSMRNSLETRGMWTTARHGPRAVSRHVACLQKYKKTAAQCCICLQLLTKRSMSPFFPEKHIFSPKHPLFCEKHIFTATAYIFGEKHTKS